ncbi:Uncharacterized protein TCM_036729 [Theobroma cacao]|uniref:Uncharacterized protein n=1 Tax=Theobroma cacao TaxID=3641 RepID=A0A061FSK0_THECC|nr:Uncharacterized protein TCM_036729 [Theobroma cacao]
MINNVEFEVEGQFMKDFESDDDEIEQDSEGPYIRLTKEEEEKIRKPWRHTLIVKLLERDISYTYLYNRVKSDEASIDSVVAWIRLLGMPLEFYDREVLTKIENLLGKTLKVDWTTSYATKGKFARFGHGAKLCPIRQMEQEEYSEEQAQKLVEDKKLIEKDYESSHFGPWMIAKKSYKRNNRDEKNTSSDEEFVLETLEIQAPDKAKTCL